MNSGRSSYNKNEKHDETTKIKESIINLYLKVKNRKEEEVTINLLLDTILSLTIYINFNKIIDK